MAKLADALVLGSSGSPCRFKSCYPHQQGATLHSNVRFSLSGFDAFFLSWGIKKFRFYLNIFYPFDELPCNSSHLPAGCDPALDRQGLLAVIVYRLSILGE